jgi:hypothetical protein
VLGRSRLGFEGGSHLLENKTLAARDKSTSKCIFSLCKIRAYASWPEHALSPIGGAESRCPLLPAICALRGGKFNQGVYSVKKLGQTGLVLAFKCWWGTATAPRRGKMLKLINSKI